MSEVAAAALAGYGCALLLAWAAGRVEKWWEPKWRAGIWAFRAASRSALCAAALGAAATLPSEASLVSAAAAGTLAWLIAQGYVLLLLSARR